MMIIPNPTYAYKSMAIDGSGADDGQQAVLYRCSFWTEQYRTEMLEILIATYDFLSV